MDFQYEILKTSIQALSLVGVLNITGFVCSWENLNKGHLNEEDDKFAYNWTIVDRALGFVSKPGRNLAYLISKKN